MAIFRALFVLTLFLSCFLVILELPDLKVAGLSRGAAVWKLLCRLLVEPFDSLALVASKFRGKSKHIIYKARQQK